MGAADEGGGYLFTLAGSPKGASTGLAGLADQAVCMYTHGAGKAGPTVVKGVDLDAELFKAGMDPTGKGIAGKGWLVISRVRRGGALWPCTAGGPVLLQHVAHTRASTHSMTTPTGQQWATVCVPCTRASLPWHSPTC